MVLPKRPVLLLALAAPTLLAADLGRDAGEGQVTTMTFHERIIVRVPRLSGVPQRALPQPVTWKEHRGPKCIDPSELAGALVSDTNAVDLVLTGNRRIRARLDGSCEPLDFYSGFYLKPSGDGRICADRDSIRARSGLSCPIDSFRLLKPVAAKGAPKRGSDVVSGRR